MPIEFEMEAYSKVEDNPNIPRLYSVDLYCKISFNSLDDGANEIRNHLNAIAEVVHNTRKINHQ